MNEEWKQIDGFPNYMISNLGRVMSINKKKIIKQYPTYNGYFRVQLNNQEMSCRKRVHSLVLNAFISSQPEGKECNHIDCNKNNNVVTNLEYVTRKENIHHAIKNGKHPMIPIGEPWNCLSKRLSGDDIKSIRELSQSGTKRRLIAKQFDISKTSVYRIARRGDDY